MTLSNVSIDGGRLLADLYKLRGFGTYKTGVHRPTYTKVDMESRHWIAEQMRAAGLEAEIDGIGNVYGRSPGDGPRVLLGSHSETQPHAGWLDGAMGVIYGLEVARAFNCTRAQVFTKVLMPAALPFVIVGLRLGIGRALTGVVVGELFASRAGVGYLITSAGLSFDTATVFLGVLIFSLMGVLLMEGLKILEQRLAPWRKSVQEVH